MVDGLLSGRGSLGAQSRSLGSQVSSSLPAAELLKPKARETLVDGFMVPEVILPPFLTAASQHNRPRFLSSCLLHVGHRVQGSLILACVAAGDSGSLACRGLARRCSLSRRRT